MFNPTGAIWTGDNRKMDNKSQQQQFAKDVRYKYTCTFRTEPYTCITILFEACWNHVNAQSNFRRIAIATGPNVKLVAV